MRRVRGPEWIPSIEDDDPWIVFVVEFEIVGSARDPIVAGARARVELRVAPELLRTGRWSRCSSAERAEDLIRIAAGHLDGEAPPSGQLVLTIDRDELALPPASARVAARRRTGSRDRPLVAATPR